MSDGITEARRGTYFNTSISNPELYSQIKNKDMNNVPIYDNILKKMPNPKWHRYVSFIKSSIRIIGYFLLPVNLVAASAVLILSEIIGIIEELV